MVEKAQGLAVSPFAPMAAEAGFAQPRASGRTELLPARIKPGVRSIPILERLGRGGSARLSPLIEADGLAVIQPGEADINPGDRIGFLPFGTAFSL
jgi:molybdopterin molybdotransferase